jgi:S1-C subfamily serine protease
MSEPPRRAPKLPGLRAVLLVSAALLAITWYALPRWSPYFQTAVAASPRPTTERGQLTGEEQQNIDIFEKWKASVVYIATSDRVMDYWTRNVTNVPRGTGSGFIWDPAGHVVTNVHVIAGAAAANVKLADGRDYEAILVGASLAHDIAVLKIRVPKNQPQPMAVGTSHDLRVGQKVFAIGNPFGLDWTLTTGIVSALDRSLEGDSGSVIRHLIQTDAAINPGNSGGPLLDSSGRLIGVNTAIYSPSGASAGVGFAVPVDTVNRVVPQLIANGHYAPPSLGIEVDDLLSRAVARELGVSGVAVLRASKSASASLRGARLGARNTIIPGDVILAIDGKQVGTAAQLAATLDDYEVGDRVMLSVWREGKQLQVAAVLQSGDEA